MTTCTVRPHSGDDLEVLALTYDEAKAEYEKAKIRLEEITNAIKDDLRAIAPLNDRIVLEARGLIAPLRLLMITSRRIDTARLKTERPDIFDQFVVESTTWNLARQRVRQ